MPESMRKKTELSPFAKQLADRILQAGPVTVADYMETVVSHYYATQNPFGQEGDFITAPEISQLFGEMIGVWLTDIWLQSGRPDSVQLIELGPGRGTLSADIMRVISNWPELASAVTLHMVETSPNLRDIQARTLKSFRPTWYDRIEEIPSGFSFIVANEFFDALPVHQFEKIAGQWMERHVKFSESKQEFEFTHLPPSFDLSGIMPEKFIQAKEGSVFEVSPASLSVIQTMTKRLNKSGGAALIIDYGHDQTGLGDTLQAIKNHRSVPVFDQPGEADLTAHVDFVTLRAAGCEDARVFGPATQGDFLTRLGVFQRAQILSEQADDRQKKQIQSGVSRLTAPAEMGTLFKVMAILPQGSSVIPEGFGEDHHIDAED